MNTSLEREYVLNFDNTKEHYLKIDAVVKRLMELIGNGYQFIGLVGELGAGKTFLTQKLLEKLGYKGKVQSPTFVIMRDYPVESSSFSGIVHHIDMYRLEAEDLSDFVDQTHFPQVPKPDDIYIVEWYDRISNFVTGDLITIEISIQDS